MAPNPFLEKPAIPADSSSVPEEYPITPLSSPKPTTPSSIPTPETPDLPWHRFDHILLNDPALVEIYF